MNDWQKQNSPEEQRLFDLLADGELDDVQRREFLSSLDDRPDGWRRCAAALLEAQEWRRGARSVVQTGEPAGDRPEPPRPAHNPEKSVRAWRDRTGLFLGMAASFLAAFGLSWALRGEFDQSAPAVVSGQAAVNPVAVEPSRLATSPRNSRSSEVGIVTLAGDGEESLTVPYVSADRFDPSLFAAQPLGVPAGLLQELKRTGHQVRQSRQIVPLELQDGSQLILPVDRVDVKYVGFGFQ